MDKPELPKKKSEKKVGKPKYPQFSARIDGDVKVAFLKWAKGNDFKVKDATEYALKLAMHSTRKPE